MKEEYNIKDYNDEEMYKILNLESDVSDRVLEGKIIQLHRKYKNMQNEAGEKLATFFKEMHDHFFNEKEESVENFENQEEEENNTSSTTLLNIKKKELKKNDKEEEKEKRPKVIIEDTYLNEENEATDQPVILTKEISTSKGKLNPLIQDTIKRVISIDSQYRDDKNKLATDFTFNLSEPLKDVVSLSLYSVQIPYTWYTVNSNFGSNFFFLTGDEVGINNDSFNYKIEIPAGNYTADNLVLAINESINNIKTIARDINFGNTNINYNVNNQVVSLEIFIEQNYNETAYYLDFNNWSVSIDTRERRDETIASFLGYQEQIYYPDTLLSKRDSLPLIGINNAEDSTNRRYWLDTASKTMRIIRYNGPNEYDNTSVVDQTIDIVLNIDVVLGTRDEIVAELNNQLANNEYLINSSIERVDVTREKSLGYNENSYFKLKIYFDRNTTNNALGLKTYIEFPEENPPMVNETEIYKKVWTGDTSCFRFQNRLNELNNIMSEHKVVPLTSNRYPVQRELYFELICEKEYFNIPENNYKFVVEKSFDENNMYGFIDENNNEVYDIDGTYVQNATGEYYFEYNKIDNNYVDVNGNIIYPRDTIYPGDQIEKNNEGYLLNHFLNALNIEINKVNESTKSNYNIVGDFNINNTLISLTSESQIQGTFDITKTFNNEHFILDFTDSILANVLNFENSYNNLLNEPIKEKEFNVNATYSIDNNHPERLGHILMKIIPKSNYGNKNMPITEVLISMNTNTKFILFTRYEDLENIINETLNRVVDYENVNILNGTKITLTKNNEILGNITARLDINIEKTLSERDFTFIATDPLYLQLNDPTNVNNIWKDQFYFFDEVLLEGYKLIDSLDPSFAYINILLGSRILLEVININALNNKFKIIPYVTGVSDPYNLNDIEFELPFGEYNRDQFVELLNTTFKTNELTKNSSIEIIKYDVNSSKEFTKLRLEVRKQYTAKDYKIVFYDPFTFAACYTGVSSIRTATFDNTLSWTLGFRANTIYYLRGVTPTTNNSIIISGDTTLSTELYNYLLITLDDFNQNHLNDGLVTVTNRDTDIANPVYAEKSRYKCDPATGRIVYETQSRNNEGNNLTQAQLYTISEIANSRGTTYDNVNEQYGFGPFVKDVFGLIPIKTANLSNGDTYVEFGGTLQNQERQYFGPVNISRMAVRLLSDKGDVINLNGSNWSFSLIAEQLYQN